MTKKYGAIDEPEARPARWWWIKAPIVACVVLVVAAIGIVETRRPDARLDDSSTEELWEVQAYAQLIHAEKHQMLEWGLFCISVLTTTDACLDYDAFCPTHCAPGSRCHDVCGHACVDAPSWGATCMLRSLGTCSSRKIPPFAPPNTTASTVDDFFLSNCAARAACVACDGMQSWGCQRALGLATSEVVDASFEDPYEIPDRYTPPHFTPHGSTLHAKVPTTDLFGFSKPIWDRIPHIFESHSKVSNLCDGPRHLPAPPKVTQKPNVGSPTVL